MKEQLPPEEVVARGAGESAGRRLMWRAMRIGLVLVVAGWLASRVDPQLLASYLRADLLKAGLLVQPIIVFVFVVNALRLAWLCGLPASSVPTTFAAGVLAMGLNTVVPGRLSELIKVTHLAERKNLSIGLGFSALLVERTTDLVIVGMIGFATAAFAALPDRSWSAAVMTATGLVAIALILSSGRALTWLLARVPARRLADPAAAVVERMREVATPKKLGMSFLLGIVAWSGSVLSVALFLGMVSDRQIGLDTALLVFVGTTLGGAIPGLPGGFGAYEGAAVWVMMRDGFPLEQALGWALALHVSQLAFSLLAALVVLGVRGTGLISLLRKVTR